MNVEKHNLSICRYKLNDALSMIRGPQLSILVASLGVRSGELKTLITHWHQQWNLLNEQVEVLLYSIGLEIIAVVDNGDMTIGTKRNCLMGLSTGKYVCYVDDDDTVSDDYLAKIFEGLATDPDCIGIHGLLDDKTLFIHSTQFKVYGTNNGAYVRPPNHLNPIRRNIAARYPFKNVSFSEDTDYAMRMSKDGILQTEFMINHPIYHYYPSGTLK